MCALRYRNISSHYSHYMRQLNVPVMNNIADLYVYVLVINQSVPVFLQDAFFGRDDLFFFVTVLLWSGVKVKWIWPILFYVMLNTVPSTSTSNNPSSAISPIAVEKKTNDTPNQWTKHLAIFIGQCLRELVTVEPSVGVKGFDGCRHYFRCHSRLPLNVNRATYVSTYVAEPKGKQTKRLTSN